MILRGLKKINQFLEKTKWDNLEAWYRNHPNLHNEEEVDYDDPNFGESLPFTGYTPRERRQYAERRFNAEQERRRQEERAHCNPKWGHTYGCDGCCNWGIDYDDSAFGTYP